MKKTKKGILKHLGAVKRATTYHLTNKRGLSDRNKGANAIRNIAVHVANLEKQGFIKKTEQETIREGKYRTQYYELTKKGSSFLGIPHSVDFPIRYPSFEHQYGLLTAVSAIYLAKGEDCIVEYPSNKRELGYRPDAVMYFADITYIVEFERSKGMSELSKHMIAREKTVNFEKLCKGSKFVYIINTTKSKNKNKLFTKAVNPVYLYDEHNPTEKRVEQFLQEFLQRPEIKALPSYKYRFQTLHNFEKYGEGVFYAPSKKEKFKI